MDLIDIFAARNYKGKSSGNSSGGSGSGDDSNIFEEYPIRLCIYKGSGNITWEQVKAAADKVFVLNNNEVTGFTDIDGDYLEKIVNVKTFDIISRGNANGGSELVPVKNITTVRDYTSILKFLKVPEDDFGLYDIFIIAPKLYTRYFDDDLPQITLEVIGY